MGMPRVVSKPMMDDSTSCQISKENDDLADMFKCGLGYGRKLNPPVWIEGVRIEHYLQKKVQEYKRIAIRFKKLNRKVKNSKFEFEEAVALAELSALIQEHKRTS